MKVKRLVIMGVLGVFWSFCYICYGGELTQATAWVAGATVVGATIVGVVALNTEA